MPSAAGPGRSTSDRVPVDANAGALLDVEAVQVRFGGIVALDGVSFEVNRGEILGLIGPNGSGKTTLFNCLSRLYTPDAGTIVFNGHDLLARPAHRIAGLGIGRTFQNLALFPTMSVLDNVLVGGHSRTRSDLLSNALRLPWVNREEAAAVDRAWTLIEFLELTSVAHKLVAGLPFGTQKRVELARALASDPALLLLDEPAGGLNHEEIAGLERLIRQIRDERDVTVLLVEHHMNLVMQVSDRVIALDFGSVIASGTPDQVQRDPEVIRAYLGTD